VTGDRKKRVPSRVFYEILGTAVSLISDLLADLLYEVSNTAAVSSFLSPVTCHLSRLINLSRRGVIAAFGDSSIITQAILALSIGPLLAHFYFDSVIWRVLRNPEVGRALNLNGTVDIGEAATV